MSRIGWWMAAVLMSGVALAQETSPCTPHEWSGVERYRAAKVAPVKDSPRVVVFGSSEVEQWDTNKSFPTGNYVNRGIGGQGSAQMLLRFYQDVASLNPRVVVILPGINDLAAKAPMLDIQQNLSAIAQLAKANGIRVIFASVFPVNPGGSNPLAKALTQDQIRELNRWMFQYAKEHGDIYADLWSPLGDEQYKLQTKYSADGIQLNEDGYKVLAPVLEKRVAESLKLSVGRVSLKGDYRTED